MGDRIRRTVYFSGRVQGVGFRFTACAVAERFGVTGYVKNLPDGRVEMVAEGSAPELDRFVSGVQQAMSGCIHDTQITDAAARGEFTGFTVAY